MTAERAAQLARVLRRQPRRRSPWIIEDDHSGAISSGARRDRSDLAAGAGGARAQLLEVARARPADRRARRARAIVDRVVARRMLGPGWTSRMMQTILHDLLTVARSLDEVAEARRQYMARQRDAGRRAGRRWACTSRCPTASTCGCRCATSARRSCTCRRPASGSPGAAVPRRRTAATFVRVTSGLVSPDDAGEVAAALAAASVAGRPLCRHRRRRRHSGVDDLAAGGVEVDHVGDGVGVDRSASWLRLSIVSQAEW